jgi:hypothetical protein
LQSPGSYLSAHGVPMLKDTRKGRLGHSWVGKKGLGLEPKGHVSNIQRLKDQKYCHRVTPLREQENHDVVLKIIGETKYEWLYFVVTGFFKSVDHGNGELKGKIGAAPAVYVPSGFF